MEFNTCKLLPLSDVTPEKLARYYGANVDHLKPWQPHRTGEVSSVQYCAEAIKNAKAAHRARQGVTLCLIIKDDIIGKAQFSAITGHPFHACYLGFSIDQHHQGKGLAHVMLTQAITLVFREYGLNRIMANYMPANHRSGALLDKLGFTLEGFARKYLEINGSWEDHFLTSLLSENWPPTPKTKE